MQSPLFGGWQTGLLPQLQESLKKSSPSGSPLYPLGYREGHDNTNIRCLAHDGPPALRTLSLASDLNPSTMSCSDPAPRTRVLVAGEHLSPHLPWWKGAGGLPDLLTLPLGTDCSGRQAQGRSAHLSCFSAYSNILIRRTRSVLRFSCPFLSPWRKATCAWGHGERRQQGFGSPRCIPHSLGVD